MTARPLLAAPEPAPDLPCDCEPSAAEARPASLPTASSSEAHQVQSGELLKRAAATRNLAQEQRHYHWLTRHLTEAGSARPRFPWAERPMIGRAVDEEGER